MTSTRLTHPRDPLGWLRRQVALRVPGGGGGVMGGGLILAWVILCALLALVPRWWLAARLQQDQQAWFAQARNKAVRLVQEWEHWTERVPDFTRGDEPVVQAWLTREPLVEAVVDLSEGRVWLRDGDRLRRPATHNGAERTGMLVRKAIEACSLGGMKLRPDGVPQVPDLDERGFRFSGTWWPVPISIISREEAPKIVAFERHWALVKHWVDGSPQVERWLKGTLRPTDDYRFGLTDRHTFLPAPFTLSGPPTTETGGPEVRNLADAPYGIDRVLSQSFSGHGSLLLQMTPEGHRRLWDAHRRRTQLAWTAYALGVGLSGLALGLYVLSRHRDRVQADRTAALAHSLKTPLAVLQSRCDTVLNPGLSEETRQAHLLNIGKEIRHLTRLIETGLEVVRDPGKRTGMGPVDAAFFESLDEELAPAFEAQGRTLGIYSAELHLQAPVPTLRTALATLLENALLHGQGPVELRVAKSGNLVTFAVQDEGPGIGSEDLRRIVRGQGDSTRDGRGLGLQMLVRVARNEGWGLVFEQLQPGFRASLELSGDGGP